MDITVRVEVQYVAPENARVRDVLHMFRTPAWVRFMVRYISPHLQSAAPASAAALAGLTPVRAGSLPAADCSCVICMTDLRQASESESESADDSESSTAVRLPCGHVFHDSCVRSWLRLRSTCPSCRFQFPRAFAGSYAVRSLNSALRLRPEHRRMRREAVLDADVGRQTVRAVVHVTLSPVPSSASQQQFPCVLNALLMHADGSSAAPPRVDKADATAAEAANDATDVRRSGRVRRASERERDGAEERTKRLRVA